MKLMSATLRVMKIGTRVDAFENEEDCKKKLAEEFKKWIINALEKWPEKVIDFHIWEEE